MKTTITKTFGRTLRQAEHGAWEDDGCPDAPEPGDEPRTSYVVPILDRYATRLEIRNRTEAESVLRSLRYHRDAAGLYWWSPAFSRACSRIIEEIEDEFDL